jgi:hypothetical protein
MLTQYAEKREDQQATEKQYSGIVPEEERLRRIGPDLPLPIHQGE